MIDRSTCSPNFFFQLGRLLLLVILLQEFSLKISSAVDTPVAPLTEAQENQAVESQYAKNAAEELAEEEGKEQTDKKPVEEQAEEPTEDPEAGSSLAETPEVTSQTTNENQTNNKTEVTKPKPVTEIRPADYLLLPRVGDYRRGSLHVDPVEYLQIIDPGFQPKVGDKVRSANGIELLWQTEEKPPANGLLIGGYAYTNFESSSAEVMLLDASGCAAICLNGQWVAGNPYRLMTPKIPVRIKQGTNTLLVHLADPRARPSFLRPEDNPLEPKVLLDVEHATLPDLVFKKVVSKTVASKTLVSETQANETDEERTNLVEINSQVLVASLPLINLSDEVLSDFQIVAQLANGKALISPIDELPARSVVRVPFKIRAYKGTIQGNSATLQIELLAKSTKEGEPNKQIAKAKFELKIVSPTDLQTHTFVSQIDASIQRYAFLPAKPIQNLTDESNESDAPSEGSPNNLETAVAEPRLVVQLHDAGDDCHDLLAQSKPLEGVHQIAPQGRGSYGFDWEDWSAIDAREAIADFRSKFALPAQPVAIAGQGMGGHGALWLAANHPEEFASLEASFGWLNLLLPTSEPPLDSRQKRLFEILNRRSETADLFGLVPNLSATSIRLHQGKGGSPTAMSEIRELRSELGNFHFDFSYQEKSISVAEQSDVAAQALQSAMQHRRDNAGDNERDEIEFVTPDLGIKSSQGWIQIDSTIEQGSLARVRILRDAQLASFRGSTENVQKLTLSLDGIEEAEQIQIRLDSQKVIRINWPARNSLIQLERDEKGEWEQSRRSQSFFRRAIKTLERPGGLKSVFANHPLLIYGTQGTEEENQWAEAKARYDADLFRYRGNGRLDFIADREFSPQKHRDRSLIFYGNFDTNSAAKRMLARSRIKVLGDRINVGPRPELGDDLAVLLILPRRDSQTASIALVGGTGIKGMRSTTRLRYFWSGVHYPDLLVFGSDALNSIEGQATINNVRAAGYLGPQWGMQGSDLVWRDLAL